MREKLMLVTVMLLACCAGCMESVTPDQVNALTGNVREVMLALDEVQEALAESEVLDKERVEAFNASTDEVQETVAAIATAIEESKDKPPLERLKDTAKAAEPFNPYAAETNLALGIATIAAGWFANRKNKEAKEANSDKKVSKNKELDAMAEALVFKHKYQAHKAATELFKLNHPENASELYEGIGKARARNGIT